MKVLIFLLTFFLSLNYFGQFSNVQTLNVALKDKQVILYEDIKYHASDTLKSVNRLYEIYLVKIDSCVPNFCRLIEYKTIPYLTNVKKSQKVFWVESEDLESSLQGDFSIYKKPFSTTKENLKLRVQDYSEIYFKVKISGLRNNWVQITFNINDQVLEGWVESKTLCPLKHTSCNY